MNRDQQMPSCWQDWHATFLRFFFFLISLVSLSSSSSIKVPCWVASLSGCRRLVSGATSMVVPFVSAFWPLSFFFAILGSVAMLASAKSQRPSTVLSELVQDEAISEGPARETPLELASAKGGLPHSLPDQRF